MRQLILFAFSLFAFAGIAAAQDLSGNWAATYDQDLPGKSLKNKPVAIVEVKADAGSGTVYSSIKSLQNNFAATCQGCPGENANKNSVGMVWCKNLTPVPGKPGEFNNGWAIDPQTGKVASNVQAKMINPTTIMVTCTESDTGKARSIKLTKQ